MSGPVQAASATAIREATDRPLCPRPGYLFVAPWPLTHDGGVNQVILNLYRQLRAAGETFDAKLLVMSWDDPLPRTIREGDRQVTYLRISAPVGSGKRLLTAVTWAVRLLPELLRIDRFLRANHVACVNVHYPSLAALQFVLARRLFRRRLKIILSIHGLDLDNAARSGGVERRLWKALMRRADAVVSCSNALTRAIFAFDPSLSPRRVATIHNGVDTEQLIEARNPDARVDPRLDGRPFILSVASYHRKKGLDVLIRAFSRMRHEGGTEAMLALVGPDLGFGDELRALARQLGVSDHVVFCGEVAHRDLYAYYAAARVFCLPSRMEPFGIVLLEAAAFRCPVVATSVGGIPEILEDGVNACLVPPDDPGALAAQIQRLLHDDATRVRLADALCEHVKADFPWQNAHRSYMRLCLG
jgi:glycosyltransferase involved in cell wall biosynthesis